MIPPVVVPGGLLAWPGALMAFAGAYFLAALLRAVTATLAPTFSAEFGLGAADLGLLAGAYFMGFSLLQLPLGAALDRHGPRRVECALLLLAAVGCLGFAAAHGFTGLVVSRALIGMGVASCLMAPLTFFRLRLSPGAQLRCNSWMLMTGSLGMVASTLPVQLLLPVWGWRGLFVVLGLLLLAAAAALWRGVPVDESSASAPVPTSSPTLSDPATGVAGYGAVWRHRAFRRAAPLGLICYGGMVAMQALWIGPWLTRVCGWTPTQASHGLLLVNASMLVAFFCWGWLTPLLEQRGLSAARLICWAMPVNLLLLLVIVLLGSRAQAVWWAAWCVSMSVVSLAQPAVAQAFPSYMAGRALSAYNLLIFVGVFVLQWGIGAAIDLLAAAGHPVDQAFRLTMLGFWCAAVGAYLWFLGAGRSHADNGALQSAP